MKIFLPFIALAILLSACSNPGIEPVRVMSFNIRYDNPRDSLNAWPNRKEMAVEAIISNGIDIVGMQEVLLHQHEFLEEKLTEYDNYAIGRNDGKTGGEMGSIFYLRNRFELIDKSTFWLSENPDSIGSIGWDAVLPRIVSWVKLKEMESEQVFYFFNTHFSHVSNEARLNSAKLLVSQVVNIAGSSPVIITGDFNCTYNSEPYAVITSTQNGLPTLYDTHYISQTDHTGGLNSINGFGRSEKDAIIDYIFCNSSFDVLTHSILTINKDGIYISDHYPVVAELRIERIN
jgi:endonuclease/exonuclease/phosphatase family metal-dependent hydrolase